MRLSQMLFVTLREDPAEAEIPSHKLLLRAGYMRRVASGVYAYLPLLWRVLNKISDIVREEMNATGAQECLLPQLQPAELWRESGRWDTYTKAEGIMFSLVDRRQRLPRHPRWAMRQVRFWRRLKRRGRRLPALRRTLALRVLWPPGCLGCRLLPRCLKCRRLSSVLF